VKLLTECKSCLTLDACKMIYTLYKPYTKVCKVTHVGQITHFVQDYTLCCVAYKVVLNRQRWANNSVFEYYSNIIRITNIRIRIRPQIETRILFVFVFVQKFGSEYYSYSYSSRNLGPNIIRICIRLFWKYEYYSL